MGKLCLKCKIIKPELKKFFKKNKGVFVSPCKECRTKQRKIWYEKNKIRIADFDHKRRTTDEFRAKQRKIDYLKRKFNLNYKLKDVLKSRIRGALKTGKKCSSTINLLGCSLNFFKNYLESKFQQGMTWENYGYYGWHIDHIKPCSSFDLSNPKEQQRCFHYTNLQPLWRFDNQSKNDKII